MVRIGQTKNNIENLLQLYTFTKKKKKKGERNSENCTNQNYCNFCHSLFLYMEIYTVLPM